MKAPHTTLLAVTLTACLGVSTAVGRPIAESMPLVNEVNVTLSDTALNGTALINSTVSLNATMPALNATEPLLANLTSIPLTMNETAANVAKQEASTVSEKKTDTATSDNKEGWFKKSIGSLFGASNIDVSSSSGNQFFSAQLGDRDAWRPAATRLSVFDYTPSFSNGFHNSHYSSVRPSFATTDRYSSKSTADRYSSRSSKRYYDDDDEDEEDRRERKRRRSERKERKQPRAWRKKTPWHTTLIKTNGPESDRFGSIFHKRQWMADPNDGYRKYLTVYDEMKKRTTYYDGGSDRVMGTSTINFFGAEEAHIVDPDGIIYTAEPTSKLASTSQRKLENKALHDIAWI